MRVALGGICLTVEAELDLRGLFFTGRPAGVFLADMHTNPEVLKTCRPGLRMLIFSIRDWIEYESAGEIATFD